MKIFNVPPAYLLSRKIDESEKAIYSGRIDAASGDDVTGAQFAAYIACLVGCGSWTNVFSSRRLCQGLPSKTSEGAAGRPAYADNQSNFEL